MKGLGLSLAACLGLALGAGISQAQPYCGCYYPPIPQAPDAYYYRGLAEVQLEKSADAKADLSKFLELAPNAPEAATAKGLLEKLK